MHYELNKKVRPTKKSKQKTIENKTETTFDQFITRSKINIEKETKKKHRKKQEKREKNQ